MSRSPSRLTCGRHTLRYGFRGSVQCSAVRGKAALLDIVVTHPTVRSNKAVSTTPGVAAADANIRKELGNNR